MFESFFPPIARTIVALLQPVALVWLGLIALTVALWIKRQRAFAGGAAALALFVQVIGGTGFSTMLLGNLERPFAGVKAEDLPVCDAIVMLGGAVEPSLNEVGNLHLTAAGDRLVMALELVRLKKAPALCVSGGDARLRGARWIEADVVKHAIDDRQLASVPVVSFGASLDTHDEALHLRRLAVERGWKRFLLVTSAAHQRRALAVFRHEGLDVVPAPCNFFTG
ncbi:MAG TPA: YdcF family protein, partial [Chthoniobacteraceae bacterium]|nr:YdcF family protein [Chthoniobacteraceae bacterium]